MALDRFVDHASALPRSSGYERQIDFSHRARGKLFGKIAVRRIVFGNDKRSTGFFVEPVDDAGAFLSADRGQIFAMSQEGIDERVLLMTRPGMHDEPGRFVKNEEIVVFEKNLERDRLGLRIALFDFGFTYFDYVADADRIARSRRFAVHANKSGADQCLKSSAGKNWQRQSEGTVEPLSGLVARNSERDHRVLPTDDNTQSPGGNRERSPPISVCLRGGRRANSRTAGVSAGR
jgi:hypothetical protein